jgi:hypothetical protein
LIERINQLTPAFSIHVGDFKSGSTACSDEEFSRQLAHFQRFAGALVYTPGDNEWTDCHRANNGAHDPLERLAALRQRFFTEGRSLGQRPVAVENQSRQQPVHGRYVENQRWQHQGVLFATLHVTGSNNNFEVRDPAAVREFFERDAAKYAAYGEATRRALLALDLGGGVTSTAAGGTAPTPKAVIGSLKSKPTEANFLNALPTNRLMYPPQ